MVSRRDSIVQKHTGYLPVLSCIGKCKHDTIAYYGKKTNFNG